MSDAIAIKIFAAQHKISEEAAQSIMYMYGLADDYIRMATILDPVFQEAYTDGKEIGAEAVGIAAEIAFTVPGPDKSPNYIEGFNDGKRQILEAVRDMVDEVTGGPEIDTDVILDYIPHEIVSGETLEDVLRAIFSGVAPTR